jgi:hypothetical protein
MEHRHLPRRRFPPLDALPIPERYRSAAAFAARNERMRSEGTRNLLADAAAASVR